MNKPITEYLRAELKQMNDHEEENASLEKNGNKSQTWWCIPVILPHGRERQKDLEFKVILSYK